MYKIEWKKSGSNSLNSLFIDGKQYHNDCQKFAERCNYLEDLFRKATHEIQEDINEKWISEKNVIEMLSPIIFNDLIAHGELGYSMIGGERVYDRWEVLNIRKTIV